MLSCILLRPQRGHDRGRWRGRAGRWRRGPERVLSPSVTREGIDFCWTPVGGQGGTCIPTLAGVGRPSASRPITNICYSMPTPAMSLMKFRLSIKDQAIAIARLRPCEAKKQKPTYQRLWVPTPLTCAPALVEILRVISILKFCVWKCR
jgi:hypothetical protein